jgi:hypothetical protein
MPPRSDVPRVLSAAFSRALHCLVSEASAATKGALCHAHLTLCATSDKLADIQLLIHVFSKSIIFWKSSSRAMLWSAVVMYLI